LIQAEEWAMDEFDYDPDEEDEDHKLHWEEEAEESVNEALTDIEFDHERGLVRIGDDDEWHSPDDLDSIVTGLAELYDEQWYANVPFESGSAVFESDSITYAGERLADVGITDFFEKVTQKRPRKFVLVLTERSESGILLPTDSVLPLQGLGLFTSDQIAELQELINSSSCKESDLQKFFQKHPQFLSRWDLPAILPQVHLPRSDDGDLIPDFLLCSPERHRAALVDLKLPGEKLVRRQKNRLRWSGAIVEAKAQLTEYRRWFDDPSHRQLLLPQAGMQIYRPSLAVIIGRFSEFADPLDRQKLNDDMQDIEIITYDEISDWAEKRKVD
jgi:hypothetical protein